MAALPAAAAATAASALPGGGRSAVGSAAGSMSASAARFAAAMSAALGSASSVSIAKGIPGLLAMRRCRSAVNLSSEGSTCEKPHQRRYSPSQAAGAWPWELFGQKAILSPISTCMALISCSLMTRENFPQ